MKDLYNKIEESANYIKSKILNFIPCIAEKMPLCYKGYGKK